MGRTRTTGRDASAGLDLRTSQGTGTGEERGDSAMSIPQAKQMRRAYGFDEVAIVPGDVTINPAMTEISLHVDPFEFPLPILAAAMDAVVDPRFAMSFAKMGGLAV